MSKLNPRPWRINEDGCLVDANGREVTLDDFDNSDLDYERERQVILAAVNALGPDVESIKPCPFCGKQPVPLEEDGALVWCPGHTLSFTRSGWSERA